MSTDVLIVEEAKLTLDGMQPTDSRGRIALLSRIWSSHLVVHILALLWRNRTLRRSDRRRCKIVKEIGFMRLRTELCSLFVLTDAVLCLSEMLLTWFESRATGFVLNELSSELQVLTEFPVQTFEWCVSSSNLESIWLKRTRLPVDGLYMLCLSVDYGWCANRIECRQSTTAFYLFRLVSGDGDMSYTRQDWIVT